MSNRLNRQVRLAARPEGLPKPTDWMITEEPILGPGLGEVLVKVRYISVDPAMRGWMNDRPSYVPVLSLGTVMRALTVSEVVESNNGAYQVGDWVAGIDGVQDYAVSDGSQYLKADTELAPPQTYLSTLGIAGLTAYCGLLEVGRFQPGNTVLVSGAAGSVGAHVGQIARVKGGCAVGIAGGAEKCAYLVDELVFDEAIDYKKENLYKSLKRACPDGIDVFFDNVGGDTLNDGLAVINVGARVVICGAISQYNNTTSFQGPSNYIKLLMQRSRMEGFIYFDFRDKWPGMLKDLAAWRAEGKVVCREDIVEGTVDIFPDTLLRLFSGDNFGKLMIKLPE
ncbi:MAG: NADP-dependent oxidoreductase [Gammaproteobacteria bacterium]